MRQVWARQRSRLRSVEALRGALVLAMIGYQSIAVSEVGARYAGGPLWFASTLLMAALAALCGFTMARSADRRGVAQLVGRSAVYFGPAAVIAVVLTMGVIGPALTSEGAGHYASDGETYLYLLNLAGLYQANLPGVFEFNPDASTVNPMLWTIPALYAGVAVVAVARIRRRWTVAILAGAVALLVAAKFLLPGDDGLDPDRLEALASLGSGRTLVTLESLLLGALAYHLRARLPMAGPIAAAVAGALLVLFVLGDQSWLDNGGFDALAAALIAYGALYMTTLPLALRHWAPAAGPLFWRMLLFSFPVQQVWIALGPSQQAIAFNLAASLPPIAALAAATWYGERRTIGRWTGIAFDHAQRDRAARFVLPTDRRFYLRHGGGLLVRSAVGLLLVLVMLAVFAITMFALQRETVGA